MDYHTINWAGLPGLLLVGLVLTLELNLTSDRVLAADHRPQSVERSTINRVADGAMEIHGGPEEVGAYTAQYEATGIVVNKFPVTATIEAFRGRPIRVATNFRIYFYLGRNRYVPVSEQLATLLSETPTVSAGPGMLVHVLKTACTPQEITLPTAEGLRRVPAGLVQSEIVITPEQSIVEGVYEVTLAFPAIDLAAETLKAWAPAAKAEVRIAVQVWSSPEAKLESQHKGHERFRWRAKVVLDSVLRFRQEATIILVSVLVLGSIGFLCRKWIQPDVKVAMVAGEHQQYRRQALPSLTHEKDAEPGTILRTMWARNWFGQRKRIKVETFVALNEDTDDLRWGSRTLDSDLGISSFERISTAYRLPSSYLDVMISVGASVQHGTYLARGPNGAVRITVRDRGDAPLHSESVANPSHI